MGSVAFHHSARARQSLGHVNMPSGSQLGRTGGRPEAMAAADPMGATGRKGRKLSNLLGVQRQRIKATSEGARRWSP